MANNYVFVFSAWCVVACNGAPDGKMSSQRATAASPADSIAAAPSEVWWTPPTSKRESVIALAYGFPEIDESNLGQMFSSDFKPVYSADSLFERKEPHHIKRGEMTHEIIRLRDSVQFSTGFDALLLQSGMSFSASHEYLLARASEIEEVVTQDETARMRKPPDDAIFYLAEVRRGASYDVLVQAEAGEMGTKLSFATPEGVASFSELANNEKYQLSAHGDNVPKGAKGLAVSSNGPDGKPDTSDDIKSW